MPFSASDVRRLADRRAGRTEANAQSDLPMLLAVVPLSLGETRPFVGPVE
jgi:hypothetical protein